MPRARGSTSDNSGRTEGRQEMDPAQLVTMQILQGLVAAVNNLQQNQQAPPPPPPPQSKLRDFLSTRPPEFSHALEPLDADDWLKVVESKLLISQCSDREKVLYATHQLTGIAADWWTTYIAAQAHPEDIHWDEFKDAFHRHFVLEGEIKLKRREFLDLKQGSMSVREYLAPWTQLSRYSPYDVGTDDRKQECFRQGLRQEPRHSVSNVDYESFQKMVDKTFVMEKELKSLEEDRKRSMMAQRNAPNVRPRLYSPPQAPSYRPGGQSYQQFFPRRDYQFPAPKLQPSQPQWCSAYPPQRPVNQPPPQQPQSNPADQVASNVGPCYNCG